MNKTPGTSPGKATDKLKTFNEWNNARSLERDASFPSPVDCDPNQSSQVTKQANYRVILSARGKELASSR
jgi:hypothetical protein